MDTGRAMTQIRAKELESHHPDRIVTACPYCTEMLLNEVHTAEDATKVIPVENILDKLLDA